MSRVGSLARALQPKHLKAAPIAAPPKAPRAAAIAGLFIRCCIAATIFLSKVATMAQALGLDRRAALVRVVVLC